MKSETVGTCSTSRAIINVVLTAVGIGILFLGKLVGMV